MSTLLFTFSELVKCSEELTNTAFGTVKYYWVSSTSETITPSAVTSCSVIPGALNLVPHKVTFTTSTKNTNYDITDLTMKGIAEDATTVLWTKYVGNMDVSVYGTVGNTADFIIDDPTCVAPYLQFELTGLTSTTKQTVAGTITVDYFSYVKTTNKCGQVQHAGLPNIIGRFRLQGTGGGTLYNGCFYQDGKGGSWGEGHDNGSTNPVMYFDASLADSIYGNSATVVPESLATQYIIKWR